MIENDKIMVEMSEEDAKMFLEYRRHQDTFINLYSSGVFNVRNGQATLTFDSSGTLAQIDFSIVSFKRGKPIVQYIGLIK